MILSLQYSRKRLLFWVGVVAVIALAVAAAHSQGETADDDAVAHRPLVRVAEVESPANHSELPFAGTLEAVERASLGFEVSGRLQSRSVTVGEWVEAGGELARLEAVDLENARRSAIARVEEAKALVNQLELEQRRVSTLLLENAVTLEEVERTESGLEGARAALSGAESSLGEADRRLGEAVLTAPFAGRLQDFAGEPGELVRAGQTVAWLAGEGGMEASVKLPEALIGAVAVGSAVRVRLPFAGGLELSGVVSEKGRGVGPGSGLYPVTIEIPVPEDQIELLPGMSVDVLLPMAGSASRVGDSGSQVSVPLGAVLDPGDAGPRVVRIVDGHAKRVPVATVRLAGEKVVVLGDLEIGDEVVVAGAQGLLNGQAVEVIP